MANIVEKALDLDKRAIGRLISRFEDLRFGTVSRAARVAANVRADGDLGDRDEILEQLKNHPKRRSGRFIGITGTPGAGKSSLIGEIARHCVAADPDVAIAVLAVDPSSQISGGSFLGDRTRVRFPAGEPRLFFRSQASDRDLGGVGRGTFSVCRLLYYLFDIIIIETVGIGQSEIEIQHVADWVCLVLQPLAGDQIQFMKAGIMEIPDCFVINKADRAAEARASFYALSASLQWIGNLSPAALTDEIGELATSRDTAGRDLDGANERTDGEDGARQPSSGELDSSTAGGPRILCTSAKTGLGIDELASEISRQRGAQTRSMAAKEPYFFEKWVRDEFGRFGLRALAKRGGATGVLAAAGSYDRALRAFHEQILPDE